MSDVRCGLRSQTDNICAVVIPSRNSLALARALILSGSPLACLCICGSGIDDCAHAQSAQACRNDNHQIFGYRPASKEWKRMDLPRAQAHSDAVPIGRAVDGCSLYFNANLPMQESSQRTTIERIKKDFRLNARLRHSVRGAGTRTTVAGSRR